MAVVILIFLALAFPTKGGAMLGLGLWYSAWGLMIVFMLSGCSLGWAAPFFVF